MRPKHWIIVGCVALAASLATVAVTLAAAAARDDPFMDALCTIPPIMNEQVFLNDRVGFNWTGTTGTPIDHLPVEVPGYAPGPDATMEEMGIDRATQGSIINAALGFGRVWARPPRLDPIAGIPPELLPPLSEVGVGLVLFGLNETRHCPLAAWIESSVRQSENPYPNGQPDFAALQILEELESRPSEALRMLRATRAAGRCLTATATSRSDLPLHAFRTYERRRAGPYTYTLSPHIVARGKEVVYFSMGVVRQSRLKEQLGFSGPDPTARVCCVIPTAHDSDSRFGIPKGVEC